MYKVWRVHFDLNLQRVSINETVIVYCFLNERGKDSSGAKFVTASENSLILLIVCILIIEFE